MNEWSLFNNNSIFTTMTIGIMKHVGLQMIMMNRRILKFNALKCWLLVDLVVDRTSIQYFSFITKFTFIQLGLLILFILFIYSIRPTCNFLGLFLPLNEKIESWNLIQHKFINVFCWFGKQRKLGLLNKPTTEPTPNCTYTNKLQNKVVQ